MWSGSWEYGRYQYHPKSLAQKWSCAKTKSQKWNLRYFKSSSMSMKLPQELLSLENWHFWNFKTSPFSKSVDFLILGIFFKNGSPEQTTMLTTSAAKFWVEPRSPFSEISHHDPKTIGKPFTIVSWPECLPEFPDDADDDDGGHASTLSIWPDPLP